MNVCTTAHVQDLWAIFVVMDIFKCDKNWLPKNIITFLPVTTGFLVSQ